jgi:regulatory protein
VAEEKPDTPAELKARALRYLVRREHSRAELARKLAPRAESPEALQVLLDHLVSRKQLSDERFAQERARSLSRKYGPAKIRQDLRHRGIADEVIEQLSPENEAERARAILARKYRQPAASREERARQARFLQGRGFSYEAIKKALALSDSE